MWEVHCPKCNDRIVFNNQFKSEGDEVSSYCEKCGDSFISKIKPYAPESHSYRVALQDLGHGEGMRVEDLKMAAKEKESQMSRIVILCLIIMAVIAGLCALGLWGCPQYRIYSQDKTGQAQLRQQEWEKQILIEEARAKKDSAKLLAESEVFRAEGVAEANKIIGDSLKGNEAYLRYLWIQSLSDGNTETIYVPTEANLPILEANPNRRGGSLGGQ
jgi:hypothetical protein